MADWLYHLPVPWISLVLIAATAIVAGLAYAVAAALAARGLAPTAVVIVLAALIFLTIAFIHIDNRSTAVIALALFSMGVVACVVLIASHNRPFTGQISVGPELLMQVMPQK